MDKKCTLIAAALMVAGVFSANAQSSTTVPEAQWKAGNYYYLKTGSSVLSLSGEKADSVIVKTLASDATKAAIDSALWQITNAGTTPAKESVDMVREARKAGVSISAEVCPHHFTLCSDDIVKGDTNYKMNPPLRTKEDLEALRQGLKDDVFDVISTDHAPHALTEKQESFKKAPFGIVGLETSVALTITELVDTEIITPMQMAEKMSYNPAKILHLDKKGSLAPGMDADVVVIDPEAEYVIDPKEFVSKGKNTPFGGKKVKGKVMATVCGGKIVYEAE